MRTVRLKNFDFASHTDKGRVRERNEDFLSYFDTFNGHVFVVCDGMGGHNAGDVASELAVETIGKFFNQKYISNPFEAIETAMFAANETVYNYSIGNDYLFGMGTTMVLLLIRDDKIYYGHAGDSRLYLFKNNILDQITTDHSYVQQLLQKDLITVKEAQYHPRRNEITKAIGLTKTLDPEVSPKAIIPQNDDYLIICTDGLTNMVSDEEISKILSGAQNLNEKAAKLVNKANKNGGLDNISVQIIKFHNLDDEPEPDEPKKNAPLMELFRGSLKKKQFTVLLVFFFMFGTLLFFVTVEEPELAYDANINYKSVENQKELIIPYHIKKEESLDDLAEKFNTQTDVLLRLNPNYDKIENNRHIKIPVKALYIVKKNDELPLISVIYDVDIVDIMKANGIADLDLAVGYELIIPLKSK
jgi:serine/threonine protein phosphatase PrpC